MAYSNYAVGYNNVDTKAATKAGIPVGNTPGVQLLAVQYAYGSQGRRSGSTELRSCCAWSAEGVEPVLTIALLS